MARTRPAGAASSSPGVARTPAASTRRSGTGPSVPIARPARTASARSAALTSAPARRPGGRKTMFRGEPASSGDMVWVSVLATPVRTRPWFSSENQSSRTHRYRRREVRFHTSSTSKSRALVPISDRRSSSACLPSPSGRPGSKAARPKKACTRTTLPERPRMPRGWFSSITTGSTPESLPARADSSRARRR